MLLAHSPQLVVAIAILSAIVEALVIVAGFLGRRSGGASPMVGLFSQIALLGMSFLWLMAACAFSKFAADVNMNLRLFRVQLSHNQDFFLMSADVLSIASGIGFYCWLSQLGRFIYMRFFSTTVAQETYSDM